MTTLHRSKSDASRWPHRLWRAALLAIGPAGWLVLAVVLLWLMRWV